MEEVSTERDVTRMSRSERKDCLKFFKTVFPGKERSEQLKNLFQEPEKPITYYHYFTLLKNIEHLFEKPCSILVLKPNYTFVLILNYLMKSGRITVANCHELKHKESEYGLPESKRVSLSKADWMTESYDLIIGRADEKIPNVLKSFLNPDGVLVIQGIEGFMAPTMHLRYKEFMYQNSVHSIDSSNWLSSLTENDINKLQQANILKDAVKPTRTGNNDQDQSSSLIFAVTLVFGIYYVMYMLSPFMMFVIALFAALTISNALN